MADLDMNGMPTKKRAGLSINTLCDGLAGLGLGLSEFGQELASRVTQARSSSQSEIPHARLRRRPMQ